MEFFNAQKVKLSILTTFLDEDAYATIAMKTFISNLEGIQEDLVIGTAEDKKFLTKILYAQDHRFNKWLKECSLKPNRVSIIKECSLKSNRVSTINHYLIDFDDIISQIQRGIFSIVLPPAFTTVTHTDNTPQDPSSAAQEGPARKRKKKESTPREKLINNNVNPEWKITQEEVYKDVFGGIDKIGKKPKVNCDRYQIKGHCFSNCQRNHKPWTSFNPAEVSKMGNYVNMCCRAASSNAHV